VDSNSVGICLGVKESVCCRSFGNRKPNNVELFALNFFLQFFTMLPSSGSRLALKQSTAVNLRFRCRDPERACAGGKGRD
jgi:hypothetical protein